MHCLRRSLAVQLLVNRLPTCLWAEDMLRRTDGRYRGQSLHWQVKTTLQQRLLLLLNQGIKYAGIKNPLTMKSAKPTKNTEAMCLHVTPNI